MTPATNQSQSSAVTNWYIITPLPRAVGLVVRNLSFVPGHRQGNALGTSHRTAPTFWGFHFEENLMASLVNDTLTGPAHSAGQGSGAATAMAPAHAPASQGSEPQHFLQRIKLFSALSANECQEVVK